MVFDILSSPSFLFPRSIHPSIHPNTWQELNYEAGLFMRKIKAHGKLGKLGGLLRWALAIFGVGGSTRKCLKNLNQ